MNEREHACCVEVPGVGAQNLAIRTRCGGEIAGLMQSEGVAQQNITHAHTSRMSIMC